MAALEHLRPGYTTLIGVGDGGQGEFGKNNYFSGNYYEKFGHFTDKIHVKFGNFVNFSGKYHNN